MSGINRSRCFHSRQIEPFVLQQRAAQRAVIDEATRSKCPLRARAKVTPHKEKKQPNMFIFQIGEKYNKKATGKPGKMAGDKDESPEERKLHNGNLGKKASKAGDSDDSFQAEENENELSSVTPATSSQIRIHQIKIEKGLSHRPRDKSPALREHFDVEMNKHGLSDKIANIQQLNNYLEVEIGGSRRLNDSGQSVSDDGSANGIFENVTKGDESTAKGFTFPFQKRARSHSPPRNGQLFDPKRGQHNPEVSRKPVVAVGNFALGKNVIPRPSDMEQLNKVLESDEGGDTAGLSTGSTGEERQAKAKAPTAMAEDEWMYQRLDAGKDEGKHEGALLKDLRDDNLLQLIDRLASDS